MVETPETEIERGRIAAELKSSQISKAWCLAMSGKFEDSIHACNALLGADKAAPRAQYLNLEQGKILYNKAVAFCGLGDSQSAEETLSLLLALEGVTRKDVEPGDNEVQTCTPQAASAMWKAGQHLDVMCPAVKPQPPPVPAPVCDP